MGKYSIPKRQTFEEAAKIIRENGERIAKEIGGHIPERVVDEHIPNDEELLKPNGVEKYIAISLEKYERLIKEIGYYKGKAEALEELIRKIR